MLVSHSSPHTPIPYLSFSAPHFGLYHLGSSTILLPVRFSQWEEAVGYGRTEEYIRVFCQYFHRLRSCFLLAAMPLQGHTSTRGPFSLAPVTLSCLVSSALEWSQLSLVACLWLPQHFLFIPLSFSSGNSVFLQNFD